MASKNIRCLVTSGFLIYSSYMALKRATRFSDPVKAVFASSEPVNILKNISMSCIRTVIGSYPVDDVLTTGKNEIQAAIRDMILHRLRSRWKSPEWWY